nr:cold shock domain-containing protein [Streptomyces sp. I05A-00742]
MDHFGTVKWFDAERGHGFIEPCDGSGDVYFHYSVIEGGGLVGLNAGDPVTYQFVERNGRREAVRVVPFFGGCA